MPNVGGSKLRYVVWREGGILAVSYSTTMAGNGLRKYEKSTNLLTYQSAVKEQQGLV
jgi:hypothetical protein